MSEQFGEDHAPEEPQEASEPSSESSVGAIAPTGHPAVDEVLRSLQDLADKPVDEHVAVFESAHEQLRRALNDASAETDTDPS